MIAIVGGGITGLYLGHLLQKQGKDFQLFDAGDQVGGNMRTVKEGAYQVDIGPNSLRMNADFHHLLSDLNLHDQVVFTNPKAKKRFVLREGVYRPMPMSPPALLFGSFFKWKDLRRLWKERKLPVKNIPDESVDAFFNRRFGSLVADYLVGPFVSGIFAGDAKTLLVESAFPKIKEWEREYGSVLKGFFKGRKKSEYKGVFSMREGLGQLSGALGESLGDKVKTGARLTHLERDRQGWRLEFADGSSISAEKVVLALPAYATGKLLKGSHPQIADHLKEVNYPSVSVVVTAYKRADIGHPLDGFGALNNQLEDRETLGTIFSSSIFPGRCPEDEVLLTTFVGGARHPERARESDEILLAAVTQDHRELLEANRDPVFYKVVRWPKAIPQYEKTALAAQQTANNLVSQNLFLGGNWTGGISVPSCLEKAQVLCEQLTSP